MAFNIDDLNEEQSKVVDGLVLELLDGLKKVLLQPLNDLLTAGVVEAALLESLKQRH